MKVAIMIEVTSRCMECTLLTSNYSHMPAVALQHQQKNKSVITVRPLGQ